MAKIILKGYIVVPADDLQALKCELSKHIILTKNETGCIAFQVNQRPNNIYVFDVYEEFIDSQSFDLHQARVKQSTWGKVTKNVERHYEVTKLA